MSVEDHWTPEERRAEELRALADYYRYMYEERVALRKKLVVVVLLIAAALWWAAR